jgi:hypothetical protein
MANYYIYHIPKLIMVLHDKCASTSLSTVLPDPDIEPLKPEKRLSIYKKTYPDYYVATFIRNPYDRLASLYHYRIKQHYVIGAFENWIFEGIRNLVKYSDLLDTEPDFTGCIETLEEDFNAMSRLSGLPETKMPHRNRGKIRKYDSMYTDGIYKYVGNILKKDIERWKTCRLK